MVHNLNTAQSIPKCKIKNGLAHTVIKTPHMPLLLPLQCRSQCYLHQAERASPVRAATSLQNAGGNLIRHVVHECRWYAVRKAASGMQSRATCIMFPPGLEASLASMRCVGAFTSWWSFNPLSRADRKAGSLCTNAQHSTARTQLQKHVTMKQSEQLETSTQSHSSAWETPGTCGFAALWPMPAGCSRKNASET